MNHDKKIGQSLPKATFKTLTPSGLQSLTTKDIFSGQKVLVIGVIGAFTPSCTHKHLPDFVPYAQELKRENIVDKVVCISVADPFVLKAWQQQLAATDKIQMLTDTNAEFAKLMGLELDLTDMGLGLRSTRYAMLVEDQIITMLNVEEKPQEVNTTSKTSIETVLKS